MKTIHAFPTATDSGWDLNGMELVDWFAGQALVGMVSNIEHYEFPDFRGRPRTEALANHCYAMAEAMMAEREKRHA